MVETCEESQPTGLLVDGFAWGTDVKLRIPLHDGAEVRRLLYDAGVPYSTGAEHSSGPAADLVVAVIEQPAAWVGLSAVIAAYLKRNSARSVQTGDIVVKGENPKNAMRIIQELQARRDAQTPLDQQLTTDEEPPAAD